MRMNETHRMCVKSKEKHRNPVGFLNLERLQVRADQKLLDGDHDEEAFFFFFLMWTNKNLFILVWSLW